MSDVTKIFNDVIWYDLTTKYLDPSIYPSMKTSILENFRFRLLSQESVNKQYPFPIKLIRSIFTNASKLSDNSYPGEYNAKLLDKTEDLRKELEQVINACLDRIMVYVSDTDDDSSCFKNTAAFIPTGMWAYPLVAVKSLGFKTDSGEIFIQLFRPDNNIRQVYSLNPRTSCWERVSGVQNLSQLELAHRTGKKEILIHNMPDLSTIKAISDMNIPVSALKATAHREHTALWKHLLPMLGQLLREVKVVLSQSNIILTHHLQNF